MKIFAIFLGLIAGVLWLFCRPFSGIGARGAPKTVGLASWYGSELAGRKMANGKPFNPAAFTCASWEYKLGTKLWVQNISNGKIVEVVCADRGPAKRLNRILDLSEAAFASIADLRDGVVTVQIIHSYAR